MRLRRLSAAALVLCFSCLSYRASAGVVFVVSVGEPAKDTGRLLAPFLDEMAHQPGMYASPTQIRVRLGERAPRPGLADPSLTVADLVTRYEEGYRLFKAGKWSASVDKLAAAVHAAQDNPVLLVDQMHRDTWMTGLVALGMSRFRRNDLAGSDEVNRELARSFPNQEAAIRAAHGSEPARHYTAAQDALDARGRGSLVVDVNDPTALIYVNEWDRPQNATFEANVLPGPYRVLVRMPGTDGLRYDTIVEPNRTTHLSIDLKFDETVRLTDQLAGFVFASPSERDHYAIDYARRLATLIDPANNAVVLVQLTDRKGQRAVQGTLYRVDTGAWVRARMTPLDGHDDAEQLRALARELLRAHVEAPRTVALANPASRVFTPAPNVRRWQTWTAGAGATAALALGGGLLYLHQGCAASVDPCSPSYRSAMPGYFGVAAGMALGMLATYLFVQDTRLSRGPSVTAAPSRSGAIVGVTMAF